jgi:hypothetical protein
MRALLIAAVAAAGCTSTPPRDLNAELEAACVASGFRGEFILRCKQSRLDTIQKCMLIGYPAATCIPPGLAVTR